MQGKRQHVLASVIFRLPTINLDYSDLNRFHLILLIFFVCVCVCVKYMHDSFCKFLSHVYRHGFVFRIRKAAHFNWCT